MKCGKCGLEIGVLGHICMRRARPPRLQLVESSEVEAWIELDSKGVDGIYRPVWVEQDDGETLSLTVRDAERLRDFLIDATIYVVENKDLGPH